MNKKEMSSKDLLLSFLYSPGVSEEYNEAITGRTKLTKMMFLFEKQIYKQFFKDSIDIDLPDFEPYYFGPFSKQLFEDLSFFESIGMIVSEETGIISMAEDGKLERFLDTKTVEKRLLDIYLSNRAIGGKISNFSKVRNRLDKSADDRSRRDEMVYGKSDRGKRKEGEDEK